MMLCVLEEFLHPYVHIVRVSTRCFVSICIATWDPLATLFDRKESFLLILRFSFFILMCIANNFKNRVRRESKRGEPKTRSKIYASSIILRECIYRLFIVCKLFTRICCECIRYESLEAFKSRLGASKWLVLLHQAKAKATRIYYYHRNRLNIKSVSKFVYMWDSSLISEIIGIYYV